MINETNFLDKFFYWPTPGGMGYQLCYVGVRHAHGWYRCYTKDGRASFFLHEQDLIKVGPKPIDFFKVLEVTPNTQAIIDKLNQQGSDPNVN